MVVVLIYYQSLCACFTDIRYNPSDIYTDLILFCKLKLLDGWEFICAWETWESTVLLFRDLCSQLLQKHNQKKSLDVVLVMEAGLLLKPTD